MFKTEAILMVGVFLGPWRALGGWQEKTTLTCLLSPKDAFGSPRFKHNKTSFLQTSFFQASPLHCPAPSQPFFQNCTQTSSSRNLVDSEGNLSRWVYIFIRFLCVCVYIYIYIYIYINTYFWMLFYIAEKKAK